MLLTVGVLWPARGEVVDLAQVRQFPSAPSAILLGDHFVYAELGGLVSTHIATGETIRTPTGHMLNFRGPEGTQLFVEIRVLLKPDGTELATRLARYDASTGSLQTLSERFETYYSHYWHSRGSTLLATKLRGESQASVVEVDARTAREGARVTIPGVDSNRIDIHGISYDKRLLLIRSLADAGGNIRVCDVENGQLLGEVTPHGGPDSTDRGFISNWVTYEHTGKDTIDLYDIRGNHLDTVEFRVAEEHEQMYLRLSTTLQYMLLMKASPQSRGYLVYDLAPFLEYLAARGYRFVSTKGVANASGVPVRETASVGADTLGSLIAGDKLEVLDRSGTRVRVGEQEAWWYRVRRITDGLEGWSYGAFIDVESDQPEPVPAAARTTP